MAPLMPARSGNAKHSKLKPTRAPPFKDVHDGSKKGYDEQDSFPYFDGRTIESTGGVSTQQYIPEKVMVKKRNLLEEKNEMKLNYSQDTPTSNVNPSSLTAGIVSTPSTQSGPVSRGISGDFANVGQFDDSAGTAFSSLSPRDATSNPEFITTTTCWIAAEHALRHVRDNMPQLSELLSRYQIHESEYAVYAGFDESLLKSGVGYLEQIHVFISAKVIAIDWLLPELGTILSPFSAILFTGSSSYNIPVLKDDGGAWIFEELVHVTASKFIDGGSSAIRPPTVISLSGTSGGADFANISSQEHDGEAKEKPDSRKGKEREKQNDDGDDTGDKDDEGSEDPADPVEVGESTGPVKISFNIVSEIYSIHDNMRLFQSMTTDGVLTIERTPLNRQRPEFPKCHVEFTKLRSGTQRTTGSGTSYKQFHLRITVDPQQHNAEVTVIKPQQTLAFEKELKESSSQKSGQSFTGSISAAFGIQPQVNASGTRMWTNEVATGSEMKRYTSRITQQNKHGVVWWGFNIDDPYEQEGGMKMSDSILPSVAFEFIGASTVPAPPPRRMDMEVASYWSIISSPQQEINWIRNIIYKASKTGSYSNLCQIVTLGVPSTLTRESDSSGYTATLHVNPGHNNLKYITEVTRQIADVEVTPAVSCGQDPAYFESENLRKLSVLELPTLTKLALPEHLAKKLGASGSTSKTH